MQPDKANELTELTFDEKKIREDYEDSFWRFVMHKYVEIEGEVLLKEAEEARNDPRYAPSQRTTKRFRKTLNRHFRKKKLQTLTRKSSRILQKFAVIFLIFVAIFGATYVSVEAFRVRVLNFILTTRDIYTEVQLGIDKPSEDILAGLSNTFAPTYIPKGFRLDVIMGDDNIKIIEYVNDDGNTIIFQKFSYVGIVNIDTEDAEVVRSVRINESEGIFVLKEGLAQISWSYADRIFVISAHISEEEVVQIAESVIFIE